jgi:RimJ/RimL family protein N-acetyltransferase
VRVEPISEATRRPALDYLARSPYLNVFITHVLLHDFAAAVRKHVFVALDERGGVVGVAYVGRQIAIAAEPVGIAPMASDLMRRRSARMIVGDRDTVRAFWRLVGHYLGRPRLVRDRQLVMMVDRQHLRSYEHRVSVRLAEMDEWSAVADSSASMIRHELEYDPRHGLPNFDVGIRQMIEQKLWWVGIANDRIGFFCNVGPWSDRTAQLQGIWTPPSLRGQGLATASLAAICDRLLERLPTLSLYVNDFNEAAIALYHRVGFEHIGDFQTILL